MSDLTRDDLADALMAVRHDISTLGDVRVEITRLNGNVETLTTEVRLQVQHIADRQRDQELELAAVQADVRAVQRWQWKVAGGVGVLGILAGGAGAQLIGG